MREIKFRAWDNQAGMTYNGSVAFNGAWTINFNGGVAHLMQYTGLKDKNGKEIYEGDVVRYKALGEFYKKNEYSFGKVMFSGDSFGIEILSEGELQFDRWGDHEDDTIYYNEFYSYEGKEFSWDELEVIGNIYENPELLNN